MTLTIKAAISHIAEVGKHGQATAAAAYRLLHSRWKGGLAIMYNTVSKKNNQLLKFNKGVII